MTALEDDFKRTGLDMKYEIVSSICRNRRGRKVWEVILKEKELSNNLVEVIV